MVVRVQARWRLRTKEKQKQNLGIIPMTETMVRRRAWRRNKMRDTITLSADWRD